MFDLFDDSKNVIEFSCILQTVSAYSLTEFWLILALLLVFCFLLSFGCHTAAPQSFNLNFQYFGQIIGFIFKGWFFVHANRRTLVVVRGKLHLGSWFDCQYVLPICDEICISNKFDGKGRTESVLLTLFITCMGLFYSPLLLFHHSRHSDKNSLIQAMLCIIDDIVWTHSHSKWWRWKRGWRWRRIHFSTQTHILTLILIYSEYISKILKCWATKVLLGVLENMATWWKTHR